VIIITIVVVAMIGMLIPSGLDTSFVYGSCATTPDHPACSKENVSKAEDKSKKIDVSNYCKINEPGKRCNHLGNLSGADLSDVVLSNWTYGGSNLSGANLSGADLSGAILSGANLSGANLSGADLSGAYLYGADLRGANLSGADLSSTILTDVDFTAAILTDVDFSGADIPFSITLTYDVVKQKEKERQYAAQLEKEAAAEQRAEYGKKQAATQAAYQAKAKAISNALIADGAVDKAAEKIASLDEKLDKSNTRAEVNTAHEMIKEAKEEYNTAVEAAEKATKEMAKAIAMYDKAKTGTKDNTGFRVALQPLVEKYPDTIPEWTPERNSDAYQTGVKKVSPEEAKQRMEEMFGGTGLPMPGSSEGLKHVIPTEKEMFDSRMLAEANSPKSSPAYEPPKAKQWWCFWC
jgi:hypothetical protein